jgi:hypothetical protein
VGGVDILCGGRSHVRMPSTMKRLLALTLYLLGLTLVLAGVDAGGLPSWKVGMPVVTYWCGPPMTDAAARQMSEGGFNLVWCGEKELDVPARHGLRALLTDALLSPASLDDTTKREQLDAMIQRVRTNTALYAYYIIDEPNASQFSALGRLVAHLRERDPAHLAYINLFPTYASNEQLGTKGDKVTAYREHVRQYVDVVKPGLISYDHYQFTTNGDTADYFLNLSMIRRAALDAQVPFLNIVQACSWTPSIRVPDSDEVRYLIYTTLAYGAQGISYYIYCCPGHRGGIANSDGTPTALFQPLSKMNREFVAIARELQKLTSLGVYHSGMQPPGAEPVPGGALFTLSPPVEPMSYKPPERVRGILLGLFGPAGKRGRAATPTHAMVVNLDYGSEVTVGVKGRKRLEIFDASAGKWVKGRARLLEVHLGPGEGKLLRN